MPASAPPPDPLFLSFQAAVAGRYSLERELGRGGMGVVYLAREVRLDRPVAVKLLPPAQARDAALRERFLREARTAAKLSHPHIVPIFAVDEVGEFVFFAMAYVEGETLTDRVRARGPLPPAETARVLREVAWALAYAHAQGVIHRDVKPDNIMLEAATGRTLVADFGIAGLVTGAAGLDDGEIIGTPEFMSPEQALGERVDGRSDLYALGIVGYFALAGRLPFQAEKATEVLARQVTDRPASLAAAADGAPRKLVHAIERCLAKDPADRPQKGEDLAEQFGLALERRAEVPVALRVFVRRHQQLGGGFAILYLWVLGLASGLIGTATNAFYGWTAFVLGSTVAPVGMLFYEARRIAKGGFGPDDVALGFHEELERGREERAFEYGTRPSRYEWAVRLISAGGLGTAALCAILEATGTFPPHALSGLLGWSATIGIGTGVLALARLQRRRDITGAFWHWFWKSRVGRWLFREAARYLPKRALGPAPTHRPTELALGMAADRLFEELPRETRRQLRELPDVVRRLEGDAQKMRRRLELLQDALGEPGARGREPGDRVLAERRDRLVEELRGERDLVQKRLADAVAALETIRLNLLRLHAGTGSVQRVTTDLGLAREVAEEVDRLLAAGKELEEELGA